MNEWISALNDWVYGVVAALAVSIVGLVRKVYTNERQIELLQTEIKMRDEQRKAQDDSVKEQLGELRSDIKTLMMKWDK